MNLNVLTYAIYLALMAVVIWRVGWMFYINGQPYVNRMLPGQEEYALWLNKMLLIGYYLFNFGYVAVILKDWQQVSTLTEMTNTLAQTMGRIIVLLALMHYANLFWLYLLSRFNKNKLQTINHRNHE